MVGPPRRRPPLPPFLPPPAAAAQPEHNQCTKSTYALARSSALQQQRPKSGSLQPPPWQQQQQPPPLPQNGQHKQQQRSSGRTPSVRQDAPALLDAHNLQRLMLSREQLVAALPCERALQGGGASAQPCFMPPQMRLQPAPSLLALRACSLS